MFWFIFKNRLKVTLRSKTTLFWTLVFPIVLGLFFNLAFSNITESEKFKVIDIAVVDNLDYQNNEMFKSVITTLSESGNEQVFNTTYISESDAKVLLDEGDISGYILINEEINVYVNKEGINQTILKHVVDNFYQSSVMANDLMSNASETVKNNVWEYISSNEEFLSDSTNSNVDNVVVYFYTLIGMTCLYGGFFGIDASCEVEANLSKRGAKLSLSPAKKSTALSASFLVAILVQFIENLILMAFLIFVLGIDFGNQVGPILLVLLCGSLVGIAIGMFIGAAFKFSKNAKVGIMISSTMIFSFLAGMMAQQIKYVVSLYVPVIGYINPVNMITDALYSLYYYSGYQRYFFNIGCLLLMFVILMGASLLIMRRKKYDSI